MSDNQTEHDWFQERLAAYLAGGLDDRQREQFRDHASKCSTCATALEEAEKEDRAMQAAFAGSIPGAGFEDRIIAGLRHRWTDRLVIHPAVARAAAGIAAMVILGTAGYTANRLMNGTGLSPIDSSRRLALADEKPVLSKTDLRPAELGYGFANEPQSAAEELSRRGVKDGEGGSQELFRFGALAARGRGGGGGQAQGQVTDESAGQYSITKGTAANDAERSFKPAEWGFFRTQPVDGTDSVILPWDDADGDEVAKSETSRTAGDVKLGQLAAGTPAAPANPQPLAMPAAPAEGSLPAGQITDLTAGRKIIRSGQMEFEVDSFDSAFTRVSKIVAEESGFVASTESQKLPNGKMTGSVTLRVAPERLDTLVLKLRALGELKNQHISAQDITRQYTDLESQLRAARAMESRLLEIIRTAQGQIKDLVAAEKELGVWREKIEKAEGEVRYFNNQVSLSTLTVSLSEKDVKAAAFSSETETRHLGIETDDVETAYAAAQKLVDEFEGRIVSAVMKKLEAQQMAATITCEVDPEKAGAMTDRLKQLGNVARLESDRKVTTADGTQPQLTSKVQRKDTRFVISLYNLANIAPRQTLNLGIASRDVEQTYAAILARVNRAGGRVVDSNLNQLKADQTGATINFQVKAADADALLNEIRADGVEVLRLTSTENPDTANVSPAKRGFAIQIVALAAVPPRETISLQLAVPAVPEAHRSISNLLGSQEIQARVITGQLSKRGGQDVSGSIEFEVRRSDLPAIESALAAAGDVFGRSSTRAADAGNTTDSKVRVVMGIVNASDLPPRESFDMQVEVDDVEKALGDVSAAALGLGGRSVDSHLSHEPTGRVTGHMTIDVPLGRGSEAISAIRDQGTVKAIDTRRDSQVPDGKLARARIDLTISNGERLVAGNQGVWASIRDALGTSVAGLLWSLQLIVIGLFLVGPWALVVWVVIKLFRRTRRTARGAVAR